MKRLYFIRHGLSEMNKAGLYSGRTNTPLAEEGKVQAHEAGRVAKGLAVDIIVSSPLQRAHDTAKIIAKEINYPIDAIIIDDGLIERHHGVLERQPYVQGTPMDDVVDAERSHEIIKRAEEVLARLHALPHENVLVVSHGGFGRALKSHLDPSYEYTDVSPPEHKIPNAQIVRFL